MEILHPTRMHLRYLRLTLPSLCLLFTIISCGGGESSVNAPESPGSTTPPPGSGGLQRTTLAVTVRPESPDELIARRLGWPDGIPGATVVLRREGGVDLTALTGEQGTATFADLVEGNYQLTVSRAFSQAEIDKLAASDRDVSAWGGARSFSISNAGGSMLFEVMVAAARRGSLVFAEVLSDAFITFQPDGTRYNRSGYLELYNNSDTTITVDGVLVASTANPGINYGTSSSCTATRDLYADTAGVWADVIYQLPPVGRRLKPGEFIVIATDAIDHTPFGVRDVYDMSGADYEVYQGLGDVDNPAVPNLIPVGTALTRSALTTHGTSWFELNNAIALAVPQNVMGLMRRPNVPQNRDYLLLPRSTLLDVISYYREDPRFPPLCAPAVGENIDAAPFLISRDVQIGISYQRSRVPETRYLRRSRSSARDFALLATTPFSIP